VALSKYSNLTILLADDHPFFLKGLASVIRSLGFPGTILEARNGREVLRISERRRIDLYILDYKMPELDGYETSVVILTQDPYAQIIIMSGYDDSPLIANFYQSGIQRFMDKYTDPVQLESVISSVFDGGAVNESTEEEVIESEPLHFSRREKELIELLARGFTSQAIAKNLGLTYRTVETYRCRLLGKVNVKNTSELLAHLYRNGLI
jgi:DNA-binding NarL/FixJ family response regulator